MSWGWQWNYTLHLWLALAAAAAADAVAGRWLPWANMAPKCLWVYRLIP